MVYVFSDYSLGTYFKFFSINGKLIDTIDLKISTKPKENSNDDYYDYYYGGNRSCYPVISPSGRYVLYMDERADGTLQGHIIEIVKPKKNQGKNVFSFKKI